MRIGLAILTCVSAALASCSQSRVIPRALHEGTDVKVQAIFHVVEVLARAQRLPVVVDSTRLSATVPLTPAQLREVRTLLGRAASIARPSAFDACTKSRDRTCLVVSFHEYLAAGDSVRIRAGTSPFRGCGSYDALFVMRFREGRLVSTAVDEEDFGDCGREGANSSRYKSSDTLSPAARANSL